MSIDDAKSAAAASLQAGDLRRALTILEAACSQPDADYAAWLQLAGLYHQAGQSPGKVAGALRQALAIDPLHADGWFNLGVLLTTAEQDAEAIQCFREAIRLNPDNATAHDNLGLLLEMAGDAAGSITSYENATRCTQPQAAHFRHLGLAYLKQRRFIEAEANMQRGLAMDDRDPKAYIELGRAQVELGKRDDAVHAFNTALARNPDLKFARYWLSAINDRQETDTEKHRYVSGIFDAHAETFDQVLVDQLAYKTPWLIAEMLHEHTDGGAPPLTLDLGCGTGLCADSLGNIAGTMIGIDLSQKMLDLARQRDRYSELVHGDIVEFMEQDTRRYDLVIAADVFVYVGQLEHVMHAINRVLAPGGLLVFSTETSPDDACKLQATGRYAHSDAYIDELATAGGLSRAAHRHVQLRMENGRPIPGSIHLYRQT